MLAGPRPKATLAHRGKIDAAVCEQHLYLEVQVTPSTTSWSPHPRTFPPSMPPSWSRLSSLRLPRVTSMTGLAPVPLAGRRLSRDGPTDLVCVYRRQVRFQGTRPSFVWHGPGGH